jgi:hypothetical protein
MAVPVDWRRWLKRGSSFFSMTVQSSRLPRHRAESGEGVLVTTSGTSETQGSDTQKGLEDFDRDYADKGVTFVASQLGVFSGDPNDDTAAAVHAQQPMRDDREGRVQGSLRGHDSIIIRRESRLGGPALARGPRGGLRLEPPSRPVNPCGSSRPRKRFSGSCSTRNKTSALSPAGRTGNGNSGTATALVRSSRRATRSIPGVGSDERRQSRTWGTANRALLGGPRSSALDAHNHSSRDYQTLRVASPPSATSKNLLRRLCRSRFGSEP